MVQERMLITRVAFATYMLTTVERVKPLAHLVQILEDLEGGLLQLAYETAKGFSVCALLLLRCPYLLNLLFQVICVHITKLGLVLIQVLLSIMNHRLGLVHSLDMLLALGILIFELFTKHGQRCIEYIYIYAEKVQVQLELTLAASWIICSICSLDSPPEDWMTTFCSRPVPLSLAETCVMPLASISKVTSIYANRKSSENPRIYLYIYIYIKKCYPNR